MNTQAVAGKARSYSQGQYQFSDVSLGDWDPALSDLPCNGTDPTERRSHLLCPLLLSGVFHGLAILVLVWTNFQTSSPTARSESIAIQLHIRPPAPVAEPLSVETTAPRLTTEAVALALPVAQRPESQVNIPQVEPATEAETSTPARGRPTLQLLTTESIRQVIDGIAERRDDNGGGLECTPLQQKSEIIDCGQEGDTRDFSALERNATYDFFTAREPQQRTRTQRTMAGLASRADEIERQQLNSDIGGVVVDRFLRELRSSAIDVARDGNVEVRRLRDQMHANDSTYQQQQRAFNPR